MSVFAADWGWGEGIVRKGIVMRKIYATGIFGQFRLHTPHIPVNPCPFLWNEQKRRKGVLFFGLAT
jgi:hypothetical protein